MRALITALSGILLALALSSAAGAATRVGMLRCYVDGGTGYIVGSVREARCVFRGASGHREHYVARIKRAGVDIGVTGPAVLSWAVFAPSALGPHALAGDYGGASAEVSAYYGAGANVLVGGNARTVSLQPLSVKSEKGWATAAGAAALELR